MIFKKENAPEFEKQGSIIKDALNRSALHHQHGSLNLNIMSVILNNSTI